MKYLSQLLIIFAFTFLGEALSALLPLPIPASIYGLLLLFLALKTKLLRVEQVETAGNMLISLLPLLFVAPMVDLMDCWDVMKNALLPSLAVIVVSTVFIFYLSGRVTELVLQKKEEKHHE
ncbi:MAG: CidA/LrgA family protein [Clostridiales bacterium]|nr:CidA/LrgA family protein [Clostridiales bacterium]